MSLGCSRCGKLWDNCECPDLEEVGENRDMFEKEVGDFSNPRRVDGKNDDVEEINFQDAVYRPREKNKDLGSHYRNEFKGIKVDVYRVLQIFGVTDPVAQHIVKKLLRGTKKGHDEETVWNEVKQAVERKFEMIEEEK
jgi:hypothetical protein